MYRLICFLVIFTGPLLYAQDQLPLKDAAVYIVCRATVSKSPLIARNFNIRDSLITHCGIGFIENDTFKIYHVTEKNSPSATALSIDSWSSFQMVPNAYYIGIWEWQCGNRTLRRIKAQCKKFEKQQLFFDPLFKLNNGNAFYCSEFAATVLTKAGNKQIYCKPLTKRLTDPFFRAMLGRTNFTYYPVDFFEVNKQFKKLYEWRF